jgi:hypothetical protein
VIEVLASHRARQRDRSNQFAVLEDSLVLRCIAPQPVEIRDRDRTRRTVGRNRFNHRVQHPQGDRHVARIGGNAGIGNADHTQLPGKSADRCAAVARLALVARHIGVVEIRTAGALQQIAGCCRLVAQLARSARLDGAGQDRIVAPDLGMGGERGIRNHCSDPETAIFGILDLPEIKVLHIDQMGRCFDFEFHEVEKIRPTGEELRPWFGGNRAGRFGRSAGAFVSEAAHRYASATSVMASAMFE